MLSTRITRSIKHSACQHVQITASHVVSRRALSQSSRRLAVSLGVRTYPVTKPGYLRAADRQTNTPLAEELAATYVWANSDKSRATLPELDETTTTGRRKGRPAKKNKTVKGDKQRVNLVSEKLCDDLLSYAGSTLEKHKGCDLLDINPGAGLWSRKLHEFLQPRSHILFEPDIDLYSPFLEPLLKYPGTKIIPKSGIIWKEILAELNPDVFPHQTAPPRESDEVTKENNTLLVTANLAFHPKKKYRSFDSLTALIIHQFIDAIRTSSLFQKYGRVRMLIWCHPDDRARIIPRSLQMRRRLAVLGELHCEYINEICGGEYAHQAWYVRELSNDKASALWAARRMRDAGIVMPEGRRDELHQEALGNIEKGIDIVPGSETPIIPRAFHETLAELKQAQATEGFDKKSEPERWSKMKKAEWRGNWEDKRYREIWQWSKQLQEMVELKKNPSGNNTEAVQKMEKEWHETLSGMGDNLTGLFSTYKDNLHFMLQDPPLMLYDRRSLEPMKVEGDEFYPNLPASLIDIQPKFVHPLMRQTGPRSNRMGDCFELITQHLLSAGTAPLAKALDGLWPGAAEFIIPRCESLRDPERGGVPIDSRFAAITPRLMNHRQWEELLEHWAEWPFKPDYFDLLARSQDDTSWSDIEKDGVQGSNLGGFEG